MSSRTSCRKKQNCSNIQAVKDKTCKKQPIRPKRIFISLNEFTGFLCNRPHEDELEHRQNIPRHHLFSFVFLFTDGSINCIHFSANLPPRISGAGLVQSCLMASSMQMLAQLYSKKNLQQVSFYHSTLTCTQLVAPIFISANQFQTESERGSISYTTQPGYENSSTACKQSVSLGVLTEQQWMAAWFSALLQSPKNSSHFWQ